MSGFGERFRRAGYELPKPLIEVDGKPIIAHVLDMFPGETDVVFICNRDHLAEPRYQMSEILTALSPTARIVSIAPHKLGPVHAVLQASDVIDPDEPTIVNYCDFTCYWDFAHFKQWVAQSGAAGCIPAYRGFHPHSLGTTNYAYIKEASGWVADIQEKQPFTDNRMQEYASSGTYYFSRGDIALEYFRKAVDRRIETNGEYYVSMVYGPMIEDGLPVSVYDLQHFMQWGTPEDLTEYKHWSAIFKALGEAGRDAPPVDGTLFIPMAGLGKRFSDAGYDTPKPLIPVSGAPMVVQAAKDLPKSTAQVFAVRQDLPKLPLIEDALRLEFPDAQIVTLDGLSEGQAHTCLLAMESIDSERPLTIGACDNGVIFEAHALSSLLDESDAEVIVWGVRGHPGAALSPQMFGWVDVDKTGQIRRVSVKVPLSDPANDMAVVGAFTFRRASDFVRCAERMMGRGATVNGEYYVDTCINDAIELGLVCRPLEVKHYLGWGTPNDLRTFEYWQSCFHKWTSHPYRLERDARVAPGAAAELATLYRPTVPPPLA